MSESKAHQVEIREVDGLTLRKLVDYIYTAEIEVTEDNVQVRVRTVEEEEEENGVKKERVSCFLLFLCFCVFFVLFPTS